MTALEGALKLVVLSSVANERHVELPDGLVLHQSVPNPFKTRTTITYELPALASVRLTVFDGLGRHVRLLDSGLRRPGRHDVGFDAGSLPSGTYLYRLETGGRMVLLK